MTVPELLTLEQVAAALHIKRHALWRYLNTPNGIRTVNVSKRTRLVTSQELADFIRRRTESA